LESRGDYKRMMGHADTPLLDLVFFRPAAPDEAARIHGENNSDVFIAETEQIYIALKSPALRLLEQISSGLNREDSQNVCQ
jgi:hypothetical protein